MNRIGRALITAVALLCALLVPTTAGASVHLDSSFGVRGKVLTGTGKPPPEGQSGPFSETAFDMAGGSGGTAFVLLGNQVLSYDADGALNRGFGGGGRVAVGSRFGGAFEAAAIAVDSQGRLIVAGTYRQAPDPETMPSGSLAAYLRPGVAALVRYLPNGEPDPAFGLGGLVETDLGLPPPKYRGDGPFEYERPSLQVTGLAIDVLDRPVITGSWVTRVETCFLQDIFTLPYVARLTAAGTLDQGFARAGVWIGSGEDELAAKPVAEPSGGVLYLTHTHYGCAGHNAGDSEAMGSLTSDGLHDAAFDPEQSGTRMEGDQSSIAVDRAGQILLAQNFFEPEWDPDRKNTEVTRLSPEGFPDPSFGDNGSATIRPSDGGHVSSLAADGSGRPLLTVVPRIVVPRSARKPDAVGFVLIRLTTTGKRDSGFGRGGAVRTGFGAEAFAPAEQVLSQRGGRILVGGPVLSPRLASGYGVALARYTSVKQR